MIRALFLATIAAALAVPVLAQEPITVDPRLAGPMVQALQAEIALRDAVMKAQREDREKHDAALTEWFKNYFGETITGQK
jgi:hypothetical protein